MTDPIQVQNLRKTYFRGDMEIEAVAGVSLSVDSGAFVAIMGASGSGKSTLLHCIAGLCGINDGSIQIAGQDLAAFSDAQLTRFRREQIGIVFQAFNLIPTLSAEDNVRLPALGQSGLDEKVNGLFEQLGLSSRKQHKPDALSGGEQQRVAIARALICDPAILLLDEPTGSLDSVAGQDLCRLLRDLCANGPRTIVVVTHEPAVAHWADRVVVLRDGLLVDEFSTSGLDTVQDLSQRYQAALKSGNASVAESHSEASA